MPSTTHNTISYLFSRSKSVFLKLNSSNQNKKKPIITTTTTKEPHQQQQQQKREKPRCQSPHFTPSSSSLPCTSIITSTTTTETIDNSSAAYLFKRGNNYLFGRNGFPVSEKLAIDYFTKSASLSHAKAEGVLGFCYEFGMGVETNFVTSEKHYLNAAKKNDGLAIARLAFLRKYGRPNVKIDRSEAEEWTEKIKHDPSAIQWIIQAASLNNHPAAQYALGVCYHDGISVLKDEHAAFRWYKASADQGNARGQGS